MSAPRWVGVLWLLLVTVTGPARAAPARLRVVSFNLYHGGLGSGRFGDGDRLEDRLGMSIAELRRLTPDVIGLQEASIGRRRGGFALLNFGG